MYRYPSAPLQARLALFGLFLFAGLLVVGCGEQVRDQGEAPNAHGTVAKAGLDAPPIPVGPFLNGVFPPRTPNDAGNTTWNLVEAFPNLTFNQTLVITPNPSDDRLYVGSRDGNIFSFDKTIPGVSATEPFMDLRDRAAAVWDGGFLGLAFHPEFGTPLSPNETTFYVYYSSYCPTVASGASHIVDFNNCNPGYPTGSTGGFFNTWLRASRFDAFWDAGAGVWRGDATTEEPLFNIRLYNGSHRGGGPIFGIDQVTGLYDGYMYVIIGDQFHYETAQDIVGNFEGGSIRIVVDVTDNGDGTWTCPVGSHQPVRKMQTVTGNADEMSGQQYCIPDDNPWASLNGDNFGEFYSIGHRNPHRISVDTATGRIWSGEVGQSTREEINVILHGRNYQWPYMEGLTTGVRPPPTTILGIEQPPVIDFVRTEARTIIGGYVYRGTKFPELVGKYLAGDYSTNNVWAITLDEPTMTATKQFLTTFTPGGLATFGQDNDGEVYLGDVFGTQALYTLDRVGGPVPEPPALLSQIGAFDDLANLDPSAYWVPYELNQPFWSDGAAKFRWIASPNDGTRNAADEQIVYSETGNWGYPVGTVLMKHFELPLDESDPSIRTRLETRFLVLGDDAEWYGVTYRWQPGQLDADLLTISATANYDIQLAAGGTRTQSWLFPSRLQCMACHIPASGGALGLRTHQQNGDMFYPSTGRTDNQLVTWNQLDMFSPAIDEATLPNLLRSVEFTDVTASLEDRARSWLDSNCGYCHRPGGVNAGFDARLTTPFENQGMVYGAVRNDLGFPGMTVLTPGDPDLSAIYQRAGTVGTFAMPPLAKALAQSPAVDIVGEWIRRVDPNLGQNGINYEYYETGDLTELPDFGTLTPTTTGTVSTFDIGVRQQEDFFAFRFTSLLYVDTAGDYTFFTSSDDGSELWLDGALVVDNGGLHADQEQFSVATVAQGYHSIGVTMFERTGSQALTVSWQGPDTSGVKEQIPVGRLFLQQPTVNNDPPSLTNPGPQQDTVGESVSLSLQATDPNGDLLYFDAAGLPPGLAVDHATGAITGTLTSAALGTHNVTASASDANEVSVVTYSSTVSAPAGGCGDGTQGPGEECDDGNLTDGDGCTSSCVLEFCGDGVVNNGGVETCDPPNTTLCSSTCTIVTGGMSCSVDADCNDGDVCTDDQCDPGTNTCLHDYIAVACDDQNACTSTDVCTRGVCVGGNLASGCTSCEGVADIPPGGGVFFGSIAGSSFLSGSCGATQNTPERVYRWVPDVSGPATFETCGPETDYDTALYVRTDACETGAELGCNDDTDGCGVNDGRSNAARHGSRVQFVAEQGRPYFIVVSGYNGRSGNYKLTASATSASCGNGVVDAGEECDGADASNCVTGSCQGTGDANPCSCVPPANAPDLVSGVSELGIELDTTVPSEDVAEGCASATSGIDILRFRTNTENIGNADMVLGAPGCPDCSTNPGASCTNPNFVCSPPGGHGHPHYDNFARFDLVDSTTRAVVATTHKRGFCLLDSFCDTGTSTYSCGFQGISAGCGDSYRRTLGCQFVEITGVPSGDYELQVTVDPFDLFPELDETNNVSAVPVTITRGTPGTVTPLPPLGGVVAGFTSGSSAHAGSCSGATGNAPEEVFSLTATTSGTYTVQTCGQNTLYDTVMYVREGALDGSEVGCNDDTDGCGVNDGSSNAHRRGSLVSINATAGETYYVFVDGYNAGGAFELTVTRPDGGFCGNGAADGPEACDGADDAACPGLCQADCSCAGPPNVCGDGVMGGTEVCDGADDAACPGLCQSDCTCPPPGPVCGDDIQEGGEECDGSDDLACPGLCLTDCICVPPTAISATLVPLKDNTLYESISGDLSNGAGDHLFAGLTGDGSKRRALMAFDVAGGVPAGSIIHAATVTLHMSRTVGQAWDIGLHRLTSDWGEGSSHAGGEEGGGALATDGDATWLYTDYDSISPGTSPAWSTPGGDFTASASATTLVAGEGFYSWFSAELAADAQTWLDNPASNYGWIAIGDEQNLATAKRFDSGENGNTASWPQLEVYFSPPSPDWGACCATDGSCGFSLDSADCSTQGGVYQGDATICSPNPCPQPTGACCMLDRSCAEVTQTQCTQAGGSFSGHLSTCAATECPILDLQPYVDALPIPAVAQPLSGAAGSEAHYEIAMTEFTQQLHSDLPPTTVWGYDGTFPGPTIEATTDERVTVDWVNNLRDGQGDPRTDHYLPVDLCPHGPNMFGSTPRTVVHLHGAHTTEESDGYPEDTTLPGESNFYEYPNHQLPATLWYHDHALGITRLNVYMGLAGFYLIRDAFEQSLGLPDGEHEVPLVIQDRSFNVDGSFRYPEQWQETFFGDHNLVNGKVSPYLNVKQGKYRFRVLNGANSRTYTIALSGGVPFQVIGTDGGLLPAPVTMNEITLAPAERADVIIDFSALPPGTEVIMTNSASAPVVAPPGTNVTPDVMKFVVQGEVGFTGSIPTTLRPITPHQEADAVEHRDFELTREPDPCTGFTWLINGLHWDDITEFPELGSTEVWSFINRSQMVHPMHMHLVMFQVLDRQQFQVVNDQVVPIGSPVPPAPHEAGWKDTVPVHPNEIVRVIAKFEDYTGKFAYHCHVIEHEDQEMMRQYQVVDSCGNGVLGPTEQCEVGEDTACPGLCQADCTCAPPPVCGNGVRETGEECDGADVSACSTGQCYASGSSEGPECTCVPPSTDIPPGGGIVTGFTSGASNLSGSCGSGSVNAPEQVLSWVPDFTGEVTLETCSLNTEFDTVLYIREGSPTGNEIGCNDDTSGCGVSSGSGSSHRHGSRITVNVAAGQTYYVVVDGYRPSTGAEEGPFELSVTPTGVSLLPDLTATVSGLQVQFNTTVPASDLAEGCASASSGIDLLRFTGTTNNVGPGDLVVGDPGCPDCVQNPLAACTNPSFACASSDGHGEYQNFVAYELLDATGQNVVAQGYRRGLCLRDDVCSSGSPTYDCNFQGLSAGCSDVYANSLGCQYIEITGLPPGDYFVRMTSDPLNLFEESNEANNIDLVPVTIPPATNLRPVAQPDSGTTDEDRPITIDVLFNDSDPDGFLEPSSVSVIVTASNGITSVNPTNGMITYTPNPNYFGEDTFSYQVLDDLGGADAALVTITINPINDPPTATDDSEATLIDTQVVIDVLLNDSDPEGGLDSTSVELIAPPSNGGVFIDPVTGSIAYTPNPLFEGVDQFAYQVKDVEGLSDTAVVTVQVANLPPGTILVPSTGGVIAGFTSGSSNYSGTCAGGSANAPEQVFVWVPDVSGTATIETCGLNTEFDTVLHIRDGDISGAEIGCSDDVGGCAVNSGSNSSWRHGSRVSFDVIAGQTYYVFADGYSPSTGPSEGNFELTVIPAGP